MNAFYEHHKDNIRFNYRCFDRILLNGLIQPFQQPERAVGFFSTYRDGDEGLQGQETGSGLFREHMRKSTGNCVSKRRNAAIYGEPRRVAV